jgi:tetratricopeptide (TPR) repeat protein
MSFETFARVALDRGDSVRAMLILIEGLKRHPENEQALATLVNLHGAHSAPGLERDVVAACSAHPEAPFILGQLINRLDARGMAAMVARVEQAADALGLPIERIEDDPDSDLLTLSQLEALIAEAEAEPIYLDADLDLYEEHIALLSDELPTLPPGVEDTHASQTAPGYETDPGLGHEPFAPRTSDTDPGMDHAGVWDEQFEPAPSARPERHPEPEAPRAMGRAASRAAAARLATPRGLMSAAALVLLVGVCTATGWMLFSRSAADAAQERRVEVFDPLMPTAYEVARSRAEERWGGREDVVGRDAFVAALRALELGEPAPEVVARETSWSYGAEALAAIGRREPSVAISRLATLERRWPDALATLWTRARLEESRGHMSLALSAYQRLHLASPRFVPALTGAMRAAHATGDARALSLASARLAGLNPGHPYLAQQAPTSLTPSLWSRALPALPPARRMPAAAVAEAQDAYLRAMAGHEATLAAWRRGELEEAWSASERAVADAPWSPDIVLVHGALQAARGDAEGADATFMRLASAQGLTVERRLELMWIAPRALAQAGRPDLGWRWTLGSPQLRDERPAPDGAPPLLPSRTRPVSLSLTPAQLDASPIPLVQQAALARVHVLRVWGKGEQALDALELMDALSTTDGADQGAITDSIALERGLTLIESGQLARAEGWLDQQQDAAVRPIVLAWLLLARGQVGEGLDAAHVARQAAEANPEAWRVLFAAMHAAGQSEQAVELIEQRRVTPPGAPALRDLAALLHASAGQPDPVPAGAASWTSPARLASLAMSQLIAGEEKAAQASATRALELAPRAPEVVRVAALIARASGQQEQAAALLESAGLGPQAALRLWLDLGQLSLERRRLPAAREAFELVLEAHPTDMAALSGLVRACEGLGLACRGSLEQRWGEAQGDPRRAALIARGLAVALHSRTGSAEGLAWLEQARRRDPASAELSVEFATYWRALGQEERAHKAYLEALSARDTFAPAYLGLARLALKAKQMPQAREHLTRYLSLSPRGADADWARRQLESK